LVFGFSNLPKVLQLKDKDFDIRNSDLFGVWYLPLGTQLLAYVEFGFFLFPSLSAAHIYYMMIANPEFISQGGKRYARIIRPDSNQRTQSEKSPGDAPDGHRLCR
jgi:hypothetical protein